MNAAARLVGLGLFTWSGWWAYAAWFRYALERRCIRFGGLWLPCGPHDWQTPLLAAMLPLAALGCWMLFRWLGRGRP